LSFSRASIAAIETRASGTANQLGDLAVNLAVGDRAFTQAVRGSGQRQQVGDTRRARGAVGRLSQGGVIGICVAGASGGSGGARSGMPQDRELDLLKAAAARLAVIFPPFAA